MLTTRLAAAWIGLLLVAPASQVFANPPAGATIGEATTQPAFLQVIRPGVDNVPKVFNTVSLAIIGDYLYAGEKSQWSPGSISYLKRNADGTLSYGGTEPVNKDSCPVLCSAGGRLYALLSNYAQYKLACYDIDPATGKPAPNGADIPVKVDWAGSLTADREGKNLYLWGQAKLLWFKIGPDGKPELAGEVAGNGFPHWPSSSLYLTPDGKHIYCADGPSFSIACVERKPDGSVSLKKNISLDVIDKGRAKAPAASVFGSPDGKWVYVSLFRGENPGCSLGIFKRDAETGDLTLQESGSGNDSTRSDLKLANLGGLNMVFLPDGTGGYAGTTAGALLQTFRCDPTTGHISDVMDITAVDYRQFSSAALLLDGKKGVLYGTGGNGTAQALWSLTAQRPPAAGSRSDIQTPLVGTRAASEPEAAFDWPRWRGANYDSKSLMKGIRKNWTGGLKKVWEVKGLSPGTATYSAPCVKGNKLVVMGRHGGVDQLFCFDADKGGKPLWIAEFTTGGGSDYGWGDGPQSTPCIDGDKVYFASRFGNFLCASMADGKILWRMPIRTDNHGYGAAPLVWDDLVILPLGENRPLAAYKKDTGEKVWVQGDHPGGEGTLGFVAPMRAKLDGKEQIVFNYGNHICGLDHATGQVLWDVPYGGGGQYCAPLVSGNIVYATANDYIKAVTVEDGKAVELWKKRDKDKDAGYYFPGHSEAVELDGYVYSFVDNAFMGGSAGDFRCGDIKTGQTRWIEKNTCCGTVTMVDGCLVCLTFAGDLFLLDPQPDGFKKLAEMKGVLKRDTPWMHHGVVCHPNSKVQTPCWTVPVVARGKVYLRLSDELLCYDLMN